MKVFGVICFAFAAIDFAGMFFGYDITGVSWSPVVALAIGGVLLNGGNTETAADKPQS